MTREELKALILGDAVAKDFADRGIDNRCADRCVEIAPWVHGETTLTEKGLFQKLGARNAASLLESLNAYAGANQFAVQTFLKWLDPSRGGMNFGDPEFLEMIDEMVADGDIEQETANVVKGLSLQQQKISAGDVSDAWAEFRPNGKIQ